MLPLVYVLLPYIFSGNFIILGGVTVFAFLAGLVVFIVLTNTNIGANLQVIIGTGGGANAGLGNEGAYSLFVVCLGGLFYVGAQLAQFFTPILTVFLDIINVIAYIPSIIFNINLSGLTANTLVNGRSALNSLGSWYPLNINVVGISVFGALDAVMGFMFILGLYFMVASRGH
jgi:hypothetical protein